MNFTAETLSGNLCRTCMGSGKNNKTISIFNKTECIEDNVVTIMELLLLTTPQLNIEKNDMLSKVLCGNCLESLINAYKFQKMCIRVEKEMRKRLNKRAKSDPPCNNVWVKQAVNEPSIDRGTSLTYNMEADEKDVKFAEEENQCNSDNTIHFEDDISREDTEWKAHKMNISKTPKNNKQDLENKKICHKNSNKDKKGKRFVCDECGSGVKTQGLLKKHKKNHIKPSAGQKKSRRTDRHECEFCKKVFQHSRTLKEHVRVHTGEQPYLCSYCGKAFHNLRNMQQHYLRHSTDRPYECPYCPKRFRCSSDLSAHKTVHNKKKPHICDVCGSGFAIPSLLKKHKMYHTGERNYKCDFCEMRFFVVDHCRRHMRTHTGEKPYKCKYCERAFAQSNDMIKHLRVHLGDNVYKCDLCPQGYRLQRDLRIHFYTHKNDDEETRARNLQAIEDEEQKIKMKLGLVESKQNLI